MEGVGRGYHQSVDCSFAVDRREIVYTLETHPYIVTSKSGETNFSFRIPHMGRCLGFSRGSGNQGWWQSPFFYKNKKTQMNIICRGVYMYICMFVYLYMYVCVSICVYCISAYRILGQYYGYFCIIIGFIAWWLGIASVTQGRGFSSLHKLYKKILFSCPLSCLSTRILNGLAYLPRFLWFWVQLQCVFYHSLSQGVQVSMLSRYLQLFLCRFSLCVFV